MTLTSIQNLGDFTFRNSKNNKSRIIPLNKTLKETLEPLLKNDINEYLFGDRIIKRNRNPGFAEVGNIGIKCENSLVRRGKE